MTLSAPRAITGTKLRGLLEIPIVAGLAVLIVIVLRAVLVQPFYIPSASMEPQLKVNDKILVSRLSYRLHSVHRGDLIVFSEPPSMKATAGPSHPSPLDWVGERLGLVPSTDELVKRVIGLPGDTVQGMNGHVYVNGHLLVEPYLAPYIPAERTEDFALETVPKDMVWVMGDNREDSEDSRYFGAIPKRTIVGRAVVRVWPLDHLSFL